MTHYRNLPRAFNDERTSRNVDWSLVNDTPRYWWVNDNHEDQVIQWECRPFPGCDTLVVTTKVELREDLRGQGLGKFFREFRHAAYKRAGFKGELATVRSDNAPQNALMERMGANKMGTFPSDFGGTYSLWLTDLERPVQVPHAVTPVIEEANRRAREERAAIEATRNGPSFMERHGIGPFTRPTAPAAPPVASFKAPAPIVDTCGRLVPNRLDFCTRPLGHANGCSAPIPEPPSFPPPLISPQRIPVPAAPPLPMPPLANPQRAQEAEQAYQAFAAPKKKFSHWK